MRFLLTMNMPSAQGNVIHQLTVDHDSESIMDFCEDLNNNPFIIVRLLYRIKEGANFLWRDKGDLILNTELIGKVVEFHENEKEFEYEPLRSTEQRFGYAENQRPALRQRRSDP